MTPESFYFLGFASAGVIAVYGTYLLGKAHGDEVHDLNRQISQACKWLAEMRRERDDWRMKAEAREPKVSSN